MKNSVKILALLLALTMLFTFTACDSTSSSKPKETNKKGEVVDPEEEDTPETGIPVVEEDELEDDDLAYVLIYNPLVFDQYKIKDKTQLSTGDFGNQIEAGGFRGDGLEDPENAEAMISMSQGQLNANIAWEEINMDGSRGDPLGVD